MGASEVTSGVPGSRSLALAAAALITCVLALPAAALARDATVESFDATSISLHFFPAEGLGPGDRAATVLVGPGFGQPGEIDQNSASLEAVGNVGVGPLRQAGYNVLTWDPRGFGTSGGQVEVCGDVRGLPVDGQDRRVVGR